MTLLVRTLLESQGEIVRFLISGGMAFFTNISLLYLLTDIAGMWYLTSSVFAFIAAFMVSFILQKFWTFQNKELKGMTSQLALSFLVAVVNLGLNTVLLYLFVEYAGVHYILGEVCVALVIAVETFFIYKYFIFTSGQGNILLPK